MPPASGGGRPGPGVWRSASGSAGGAGLGPPRRILVGSGVEPRVIVLTTFDLDHYVYAALTAGASGFLLKDVTAAHLAAAVRLVGTGDALLAPTVTRRLIAELSQRPARPSEPPAMATLTDREREVLELLTQGKQNKQIAQDLGVSPRTIEIHRARVMEKMNAQSVAELVRMMLDLRQPA